MFERQVIPHRRRPRRPNLLDEPLVWGTLPAALFRDPYFTRWSLGASDIIFKNAAMSAFFNKGQTLETFRGRGIFQPAIDTALTKLGETRWVHLFPEGAVNLTQSTRMRRFKWGVARLVLEAPKTPVVVPLWLTGFDQVMPEHRRAPRFLPRLGAEITVTFGEPIAPALLQPYVNLYTQREHMSVAKVAHALPALSSRTSPDDLYPARPATLRSEDTPTLRTAPT
ncbi:hypothetical protein CBS9595_002543 [Malassezia furfur]|nr:hypothetical protein CBS9595_002543 [Malassezia furfur]